MCLIMDMRHSLYLLVRPSSLGPNYTWNANVDNSTSESVLRSNLTRILITDGRQRHPDVDQLYLRSVVQDNTISIATVYRTVKLLEEAGVIEKLEFGDGRARYEEAREHHEHLVDVETGEVIEFFHAELEALKEEIAQKMGYELIDHRLELYGKKIKDS